MVSVTERVETIIYRLGYHLSNPKTALRSASEPVNALTRLANRYGSDKGNTLRSRHHYTRIYSELFEPLKNAHLRMLEVGLLHIADAGWDDPKRRDVGQATATRAPSLQMWLEYFENAEIFGFDINDFAAVNLPRCKIVEGDMSNRDDLGRLVAETGGDFDIIIEDASHASHHQQIALAGLFPALKKGGMYIIEDLQAQPASLELENAPKTATMLRKAEVTGVFESPFMTDAEKEYLAANVESIAMFDSLTPRHAVNSRDAIAVLKKRM